MKHSWIEKLLVTIAWAGMVGGILMGALVSKGILESGQEMCAPRAIVTFCGSVFFSVVGWAVLMLLVSMSDRLKKIENSMRHQ